MHQIVKSASPTRKRWSHAICVAAAFACLANPGCGGPADPVTQAVQEVTSGPTASSVSITISSTSASGTYTYSDSSGLAESGSTSRVRRADDSSGTNVTTVSTKTAASGSASLTYSLQATDESKYLQFCVTPANGALTGSESCSGWVSVGALVQLFKNSSYGGTSLYIAYEQSSKGACFNLTDSSFNDALSSYKWKALSSADAKLIFYADTGCSGDSEILPSSDRYSGWLSAGTSASSTYIGDSWNDRVSSFRVVWSEDIVISNVTATVSDYTVSGSYTYSDKNGLSDGSYITWYRSSTTLLYDASWVATETTYTLTADDNNAYLFYCVMPTNAVRAESMPICSSAISVGPIVSFYLDANYNASGCSQNVIHYAYTSQPSGHIFNIGSVSFLAYYSGYTDCLIGTSITWNDAVSSYKLHGGTAAATLTLYKDTNGGGSSVTASVAASGEVDVASLSSTYGSSWNDALSSFKVTY